MEKLFLELAKQHLGRTLFLLISLIALLVSVYFVDRPNSWMGIVASTCVFLILVFAYRSGEDTLIVKSEDWFSTISKHLRNANHVRVYLREFDHPDEFNAKHRAALLDINNLFIKGMLEYSDSFMLVAYNETGKSTGAATKWLLDNLSNELGPEKANETLRNCVKILPRQPQALSLIHI